MRSPTGGGTSSGPRKRRVVEARSGDVEASGHPERVGIRAVGVHSPRNTNGIALGMKRYRLLSINVMSPTEESVWMPSGNGPSTKDRKSTRLNSSHSQISYAVFCLKKK